MDDLTDTFIKIISVQNLKGSAIRNFLFPMCLSYKVQIGIV